MIIYRGFFQQAAAASEMIACLGPLKLGHSLDKGVWRSQVEAEGSMAEYVLNVGWSLSLGTILALL